MVSSILLHINSPRQVQSMIVCCVWQGLDFSENSLWEATQAIGASQAAPSFETFEKFEAELARRIFALLETTKTMSPAMVTAMQFRSLASTYFQTKEVMEKLVDAGQLSLAKDWAQCCKHELQVISFSCSN